MIPASVKGEIQVLPEVSLIYTLPWSAESAERLFSLRDGNNIQFIVKCDEGQVIGVKAT